METVEYYFDHEYTLTESELLSVFENDKKQFFTEKMMADNIPGLKYYFSLNPKAKNRNDDDIAGVFLYVEHEDRVAANFEVKVLSAGYADKTSVLILNSKKGWGKAMCSYDDLMKPENNWLINGKLTIKINGNLKTRIPFTRHSSKSSPLLSSLWNRDDKDFTFIVDGMKIKVHKFVLSNLSLVFDTMLQTQWKETEEGQLTIEDFNFYVVENAVRFFYEKFTGASLQNSMELLRFADKYDIPSLKEEMEEYLTQKISKSVVVKLANISVIANAEKLNQQCFEFLVTGFKSFTIPDIEELDADMKDKLLKLAFTNTVIFAHK